MTDQEYKDFLTYLFNEYVEARIHRVSRHFHPLEWRHEFGWQWQRLRAGMDVTNYIKHNCETDDEIYQTFTLDKLKSTVDGVEDGVKLNDRMTTESGFLSAIDDHFEEIVNGMKPEYFPTEELEVLRYLGSRNPQVELAGIIYLLKVRKGGLISSAKEIPISKQLEKLLERLSREQERFKEQKEVVNKKLPARPGRRWFKALGQICQGGCVFNCQRFLGRWVIASSSVTGDKDLGINAVYHFRGRDDSSRSW